MKLDNYQFVLKGNIEELQKQIILLNKDLSVAKQELQAINEAKTIAVQELNSINNKITISKTALDIQIDDLTTQIINGQNQINKNCLKIEELQNNIKELERELDRLSKIPRIDIEAINLEHTKTIAKYQQEVQKLDEELKTKQDLLIYTTNSINKQQIDINKQLEDISKREMMINKRKKELELYEKRLLKLKKEINGKDNT